MSLPHMILYKVVAGMCTMLRTSVRSYTASSESFIPCFIQTSCFKGFKEVIPCKTIIINTNNNSWGVVLSII